MPLSVGQKLWYVPSYDRQEPYEVTVKKIGRKWATVGQDWREHKIDLITLRVDGGQYSSPGTCYESKEAYENEQALRKAWDEFKRLIDRMPLPKGATLEKIEQAKLSLGL